MNRESSQNTDRSLNKSNFAPYKFLLFFIQPFLGLLSAFLDIKSRSSYYIIFGFCLLFGWTFMPVNEAADSFRYAQGFYDFSLSPFSNLLGSLYSYFSSESEIKDIYIYICYYVASLIGGSNVHVLFLLFSFVFAFFYLKSKHFLTDLPDYKLSLPVLILTFLFVYSNNIFNINGARFWTASWIGVYGLFQILVKNKQIYWLLLAILPLVHAAFIVFIVFSLLSYMFRFSHQLLIVIYIITFFMSELFLNNIFNIPVDSLPQFMQYEISYYTSNEIVQKANDMGRYQLLNNEIPFLFVKILLLLLALRYHRFSGSISKRIVLFLLVFVSFINLSSGIPSMHRFYLTSIPIIVYLWLREYKIMKSFDSLLLLTPIVFSYNIYYWLKGVISISDPALYFSFLPHIILKNL